MNVGGAGDVIKQFDFKVIEKTDNKSTVKAQFNGVTYKFTIIKAGIGSSSDEAIKNQYGDRFLKIAKVAELVDLKANELLTEKKDTLSLTGREGKVKTYPISEKMSVKLPKTLASQVNKIDEIYHGKSFLNDNQKLELTVKKIQTSDRILGVLCKKIAAGAAKVVWVPKKPEGSKTEKNKLKGKVIYTAVKEGMLNSIFKLKEREIREEVALQGKIKSESLEKLGYPKPKYITVDMKIIQDADGKFVAKAAQALGDLDRLMMNPNIKPLEAAKLGLGPVRGLAELAKLGYAAGDVKCENALGYEADPSSDVGSILVKLADLGKTVPIGDDQTKFYTGNLTYAPPERNLSKAGDVFGVGMITLRVMEERIFAKTGKSTLNMEGFDESKLAAADNKLRGIEHFRSTHHSFIKNRFTFILPTTNANLQAQEVAMMDYVAAFAKEFKTNFPDDPMIQHLDLYTDLLKATFTSDAAKRPTAEEFRVRYELFVNAVENS